MYIYIHTDAPQRLNLFNPWNTPPPVTHTQLNPYQWIDGLYSEQLKEAYFLNEDPQALPPHVFAVSAAAYRWVRGALRAF